MMRHALGVLFACAGALALDDTAGSDVSVSARLVLATDFDAATFNADWYANSYSQLWVQPGAPRTATIGFRAGF